MRRNTITAIASTTTTTTTTMILATRTTATSTTTEITTITITTATATNTATIITGADLTAYIGRRLQVVQLLSHQLLLLSLKNFVWGPRAGIINI